MIKYIYQSKKIISNVVFAEYFKGCPSNEFDMKDKGIYKFQEVKAGLYSTKKCVYGGVSYKSFASIKCNLKGEWGNLNVSLCLSYIEIVGEIEKVCRLFHFVYPKMLL